MASQKKSTVLVRVRVDGHTPMLQHAMSEDTLVNVLFNRERKPIDADRTLAQVAEEGLYVGPNGEFGIPPDCLFACLREAGRRVKLDGRRNVSTAESTSLPAMFEIVDEFISFDDQQEKWKVDKRRGMMNSGTKKVAVCIVRPRFNKWSFTVNIRILFGLDGVTTETVKKLFEVGGRAVGLCSFRPDKNGPFGKFDLVGWEEIDSEA